MIHQYFPQKLELNRVNRFQPFIIGCFSFLALLFFSTSISAQETAPSHSEPYYFDIDVCKYYPEEIPKLISVMRSSEVMQRMNTNNPCSTINVNYTGFTTEAEAAFQFAVDIWASSIDSAIPITVNANFVSLPDGVIGSAGPNGFFTLTGAGAPNRFYPKPLAESILGQEIGGANSLDITANFSNTFEFYFGLDAQPPSNQIDFVSVVLHELAHGIGFISGAFSDGTTGSIRDDTTGFPFIYDDFIESGSGASILSFSDPSTDLHDELISDALVCNALSAIAENSGTKPRISSPDPFRAGSSYSHWDEDSFPGEGINSLMTPGIAFGEAIHNPGPITLGFFEDMGWSLCATLSNEDFAFNNIRLSPNPFQSKITVELPTNLTNSKFEVSISDINGRTLFKKNLWGVNSRLEVSNLDNLNAALYFITVQNLQNGDRITRKIIKR